MFLAIADFEAKLKADLQAEKEADLRRARESLQKLPKPVVMNPTPANGGVMTVVSPTADNKLIKLTMMNKPTDNRKNSSDGAPKKNVIVLHPQGSMSQVNTSSQFNRLEVQDQHCLRMTVHASFHTVTSSVTAEK